jgi:hypothetical protein
MDADRESVRCEPLPRPRFSIQVDERPESPWLAADDGYHQWQSERARANERLRCPADTQPDR